MLEAAELAPSALVEVGDVGWQRIFHGPFDAGIAEFLRVEIGGIGGQVGHREVARVGRQECRRSAGAVRVEPIPDNQEGAADLAPEVPQGLNHRLAGNAAPEVPGIELSGRGDRDDAGDLAPLAQAFQHRGHPASRPGGAGPGSEAVPGFVEEDDPTPRAASRLF